MVVYRRTSAAQTSRRGQSPEQALTTICDRLAGGLANAGVKARRLGAADIHARSEEHTSELQSLMRISYAVFCLKKKNYKHTKHQKQSYTNYQTNTSQQSKQQ